MIFPACSALAVKGKIYILTGKLIRYSDQITFFSLTTYETTIQYAVHGIEDGQDAQIAS